MTREEAIKIFNTVLFFGKCDCPKEEIEECLKMAIKALEQEPCEDAISRQAVLELIADYDLSMGQVVKGIHALPSVTPQEPKTGHWEYGYAFADGNYCKCSECKEIIKCIYPMHYCPNCGCRMVEPQERSDKE